MKPFTLRFLGAADTVTGSRTLVSYNGRKFLIDCGLFQGPKEVRDRNWKPFPVDASEIEGVILTHAHLDHSGYIPRLVKEGFKGKVYCSAGTFELCHVLLRDAAYLEEEFARYANKTGYSHHKPALPLFTKEDAELALEYFQPLERMKWIDLSRGLHMRFVRAGHIPGASLVQLSIEGNKPRRVTFSGDLGNDRLATMRSPAKLPETEMLILESTYGDRLQSREDVFPSLAKLINKAAKRNGVVVIPAFAVGRSQEIIYLLKILEERGDIPALPIVLDSPMSIEAMRTFLAHPEDHSLDFLDHDFDDNFRPQKFETCITPDDSMLCTMRDGPMIVISAAGMLSGGRILHHLKRRLPDPKNMVIFSGYQADGTKGRFLQDNAKTAGTIRIHHEEIPIEAEITTLDSLSSHADYHDMVNYLKNGSSLPQQIVLNHGSPNAQKALALTIKKNFNIPVICSKDQRDFTPFEDLPHSKKD